MTSLFDKVIRNNFYFKDKFYVALQASLDEEQINQAQKYIKCWKFLQSIFISVIDDDIWVLIIYNWYVI